MTASAGQIAGWHIDGDHIIKEFSLEGSTSRVRLNARAGTNNKYHDGYGFVFYRNNADIDDADNGAVKTVKIGQIGNPDSPDYDSGAYYGIQILNSGSGGYKDIFRADESGGKIAGWTFNDASLDGGAMHVNKSGFISSSNWQISSSTSNSDPIGFISSSAFKVSADGRMTASAGLIAGITMGTDSLGNRALFVGDGYMGNNIGAMTKKPYEAPEWTTKDSTHFSYTGGAGGVVAIVVANASNKAIRSSNHTVVVSPLRAGSSSLKAPVPKYIFLESNPI